MSVVNHSSRFEDLKRKYEMNYITKATLKKWVVIDQKKPGYGITAAEYEEITGEPYEA